MDLKNKLSKLVEAHKKVFCNTEKEKIIQEIIENKEAIVSESGALATWTPIESTGRSPKDTVIVKRKESENTIDWTSPNNLPIDEETFDMVFDDALKFLEDKNKIYVTERVIGA
ncbi:MAG: phosphoenolpyruvate carboxykinase (ATP), partial [Bacteroidales bacterium]|nr:phosphoenolpyruvate carboxykinase (ATP) [Bacteroidales bacterium]